MSQKFIKNKEDFVCIHCGWQVFGDGYTNHCPNCLWSRHVDINPGDRAHDCGGPMEPIGLTIKGDEYQIIHRCSNCGVVKKNRTHKNDQLGEFISNML
jgi:predicted RNA-binding Zn-ribbon protein involved in translation (DUF1610 family)